LCVVEEDDLPDTARFVVESFGSEAIRLSNDMTSFEQFILQPTVELLNGYSGIVAFAEVLAGLRSRIRGRLTKDIGIRGPHPDEEEAAGTALVLVLARSIQNDTKKMNKNWRIEIIGSVELRLQPCDAKIPFTLPWLDRIERRLWNKKEVQQQPYLSNLCVAEAYRGQSIGRALVQCVEDIAGTAWGYSKIYLHVDVDNTPAYQLYKNVGYRDVGKRWNPFWAGSAAEIGYFVKELS
jgi:ribosomal protein S18 acetylase RimI-like enzyme